MHEKHEPLGEHGAIPGAPNGPPPSTGLGQASTNSGQADRETSFLPAAELSARAAGEADWIWDGFLARRAITLLTSEPKAGKSTLVFGLLQKLLRGEKFLGRPTSASGAIYFSEEPLATLREKTERFELPVHGERIQFVSRRCSPNQVLSLETALEDALKKAAVIGAGLIVIDTLSAWMHSPHSAHAEDENSAAACEALMARFRDAAARSGTALLLIHHTRKDGSAPRGSTALTGSADILLMLERPDIYRPGDESSPSILKVASRFCEAPDPLQFVLTESGYELLGRQVEAITKHAEIYKLLPVAPLGLTRDELCKETGFSRWKVRCALNDLVTEGAVTTIGIGSKEDPRRFQRRAS